MLYFCYIKVIFDIICYVFKLLWEGKLERVLFFVLVMIFNYFISYLLFLLLIIYYYLIDVLCYRNYCIIIFKCIWIIDLVKVVEFYVIKK